MGYYIVIPAPVRHANITDGAKLLYGDIAGLSKREGYCYASNAHLAEVAGVSKRTAENYLEQLEAAGLITREVEGEKSRRIFLTQKTATPHAENCGETHAENCDILIYNTNTDTIQAWWRWRRATSWSEAQRIGVLRIWLTRL